MQKYSQTMIALMALCSTTALATTSWATDSCQALTQSGPVVATRNGQVIENLDIIANGQNGITVDGFSGVVIRNVRISHKAAQGIRLNNAPNATIENVVINYSDAPDHGPLTGEFNGINGYGSAGLTVTHAKFAHNSTGIYLDRSPNTSLSFIEGIDFRGPYPRGQLVQLNTCDNTSLTDFSVVNDRSKAWTEDNVNVYGSRHIVIKRGLVDGNNSPSGVGVIIDNDSHDALIEDVDTIHMGGGCFSANQNSDMNPVTDVTFNRTRCGDVSIASFSGRGAPGSNGLGWCAEPRTTNVKVLDSIFHNLAVPWNIGWNWNSFAAHDMRDENFTPRNPLGQSFCWEGGATLTPPPAPAPTPAPTPTPTPTPTPEPTPTPTPTPAPVPEPTPTPTPPTPTPTPVPPVDSAQIYLSDMDAKSSKNGWGPFEKNRSNGEMGDSDGGPIKIDGKEYLKGLGVHATSEIHYDVAAKCKTFSAKVGLDDEIGDQGSVHFKVLGDGKELYTTGLIKGTDKVQNVSVAIGGVKDLTLVVDDGGDGGGYDHADWAEAKVDCSDAVVAALPGSYFLSDLDPTYVFNGYGPYGRDQSNGEYATNDGNPITIRGAVFNKGLGVHADSELHYDLNQTCQRFTAQIGLDDEIKINDANSPNGVVKFQVLADGVAIYTSPVMNSVSKALNVDLDVTGHKELTLLVDSLGLPHSDHADWAEAKLSCTQAPPGGAADDQKVDVFASDLTPLTATNGYGPMEKDRSNGEANANDGTRIGIAGVKFDKGLGVHSDSKIEYALDGKCTRLKAQVGVDDEVGKNGSVQFLVYSDGREVYHSPVMLGGDKAFPLDVDISGAHKVGLVVSGVENFYFDHADWADAKFVCKK